MRMIKSGTYDGKVCYALSTNGRDAYTYWRTPNKLSCKKELHNVTGRRAARERRLIREYNERALDFDYYTDYGYIA